MAQGGVLYRGASYVEQTAAGTAGQVLSSNGPGMNPTFETPGGGSGIGTVTSVATDDTYVSGGPITSTGTVSATTLSRSAIDSSLHMLCGGL